MNKLSLLGVCLTVIPIVYALHLFNLLPSFQNCNLALKYQKDWANLLRYSHSNTQLLKLPMNTNEVVFMGDSITDEMDFGLYFSKKPYINRGIGGQITSQMLVRFRSDVINLHPRVVIILAGTNDLYNIPVDEPVDLIVGNIFSMAELARWNKIQVILASVLPVCGDVVKTRTPSKILEINRLLFEHSSQNEIIYLDYFDALVGSDGLLKQELTTDCLHINQAGYMIMAPLAEAAIQKALQQQRSIEE